jgi:hypothetical protein
VRSRLEQTIPATSLSDARERVARLVVEPKSTQTATASPAATPATPAATP